VAAAIFVSAAVVISIDAREIRIGRASIEHAYISGSQALTAEGARQRGGVEADARAHLVLRPYVRTAVEITLDDPRIRCRIGWSPRGIRNNWQKH
jgi:hypothetical protein